MAAEQSPGYIPPGRNWKRTRKRVTCLGKTINGIAFPCGLAILKRTGGRQRCRACSLAMDVELKRLRVQKARANDNARKAKLHKAQPPGVREFRFGNSLADRVAPPRKPQKWCEGCSGLSERRPRAPDRCLCGLSWSKEVIERIEVLHSSAAGDYRRNHSR